MARRTVAAIALAWLVTIAIEEFPHTRDWNWSVSLIDGPDTVNAWCMACVRMDV